MDKSYPNKTPMVVRSLEIGKDPFRPWDIGEKMLRLEIPYLSVIDALMYLANCTRPDIAFAVDLLVRHSVDPTRRHSTGAKCILRYLNGTKDLGLFFKKNHEPSMIGYTDTGYYLILIMENPKQDLYSYMEVQLFHGSLLSIL